MRRKTTWAGAGTATGELEELELEEELGPWPGTPLMRLKDRVSLASIVWRRMSEGLEQGGSLMRVRSKGEAGGAVSANCRPGSPGSHAIVSLSEAPGRTLPRYSEPEGAASHCPGPVAWISSMQPVPFGGSASCQDRPDALSRWNTVVAACRAQPAIRHKAACLTRQSPDAHGAFQRKPGIWEWEKRDMLERSTARQ